MKNIKKSKNVEYLILNHVHFLMFPFQLKKYIFLTEIIRALLSNKNEILPF